jgi:hypothetical protein
MGLLSSLRDALLATPSRIAGTVQALAAPARPYSELNARLYAPDKFDFADEQALISDLRAHGAGGTLPPLFVLGDAPIVYLLANQPPPYHANDFNASPIYEQRKVANFIEREQPSVVVWDANTLRFDVFQTAVRNPTIYNAVVSAYVPDRKVGRFEVLRRRASGEPIAIDFWRARLSPQVALGHFARVSSFRKFGPCGAGNDACQEFLVVTKNDPNSAGQLSIGVDVSGRKFELTMQTVSGERELHVLVDRLWFWGPMKATNLMPTIDGNATSNGIETRLVKVERRDDILY